jgi:hypothetical protein
MGEIVFRRDAPPQRSFSPLVMADALVAHFARSAGRIGVTFVRNSFLRTMR